MALSSIRLRILAFQAGEVGLIPTKATNLDVDSSSKEEYQTVNLRVRYRDPSINPISVM